MPVRPQACVQVDPGDLARLSEVVLQHLPESAVAPGGGQAPKPDALWKLVLPAGDGPLHAALAPNIGQRVQGCHGFGVGWPVLGQQQLVDMGVVGIDRQGLGKVDEVAVEVHIVFVDPPRMRKAMRVDRVHMHHGHTGRQRQALQPTRLDGRAAKPLDAMHRAGGHQHLGGIGRAVNGHVHGQFFAFRAEQGQGVSVQPCATGLAGLDKSCSGLPVAGAEKWRVHALAMRWFSQPAAKPNPAIIPMPHRARASGRWSNIHQPPRAEKPMAVYK